MAEPDERPVGASLPAEAPLTRGNLAAALLWASDWCNDALLTGLEARGWPRFTRTQSLVFARLGAGVDRAADLARDVGVTRQSMQAVLEPLLADGLLVATPDPDDGRAQRLALGPRGQQLRAEAGELLAAMWEELEDRIGPTRVAGLRAALEAGWGPPPSL